MFAPRLVLAAALSSLSALSFGCAQSIEVGDDTGRSQEFRDTRLDDYARDIAGEWEGCDFAGTLTFKYVDTRSGSITLQLVPVSYGLFGRTPTGDANYDVVSINVDGSADIMVSGGLPGAAILVYRPLQDLIFLDRFKYRRKGSVCPA